MPMRQYLSADLWYGMLCICGHEGLFCCQPGNSTMYFPCFSGKQIMRLNHALVKWNSLKVDGALTGTWWSSYVSIHRNEFWWTIRPLVSCQLGTQAFYLWSWLASLEAWLSTKMIVLALVPSCGVMHWPGCRFTRELISIQSIVAAQSVFG